MEARVGKLGLGRMFPNVAQASVEETPVIPAKAGIHVALEVLDARLRRNPRPPVLRSMVSAEGGVERGASPCLFPH
jgi:hypothetical protein